MKPGRKLDMLIAKKVLGLDVFMHNDETPMYRGRVLRGGTDPQGELVPHYSTSTEEAQALWPTIEKKFGRGGHLEAKQAPKGTSWSVLKLRKYDIDYIADGESEAHALCLAALKAAER